MPSVGVESNHAPGERVRRAVAFPALALRGSSAPPIFAGLRPLGSDLLVLNADRYILERSRRAELERLVLSCQSQRVTILTGASGNGKSSLILAGLRPRIDPRRAVLYVSSNYIHAQDALRRAVAQALQERNIERVPDGVLDQLRRLESEGAEPLLILDQFEQLFVTEDCEERREFLQTVATLICDVTANTKVVIAIRPEWYVCLEGLIGVEISLRATIVLQGIPRERALGLVRDFSLSSANATTGEELTAAIVADLGTAGDIPPVQIQLLCGAVERLKLSTAAEYRRLGSKEGTELRFFQELLSTITPRERQLALRLFAALGAEGIARRALSTEQLGLITSCDNQDYSSLIHVLTGFVDSCLIRNTGFSSYEFVHDYVAHRCREYAERELPNDTVSGVDFAYAAVTRPGAHPGRKQRLERTASAWNAVNSTDHALSAYWALAGLMVARAILIAHYPFDALTVISPVISPIIPTWGPAPRMPGDDGHYLQVLVGALATAWYSRETNGGPFRYLAGVQPATGTIHTFATVGTFAFLAMVASFVQDSWVLLVGIGCLTTTISAFPLAERYQHSDTLAGAYLDFGVRSVLFSTVIMLFGALILIVRYNLSSFVPLVAEWFVAVALVAIVSLIRWTHVRGANRVDWRARRWRGEVLIMEMARPSAISR